ncbi:MAG: hypothetical protein U0872_06415 [Planctomycetaceae bacterium]
MEQEIDPAKLLQGELDQPLKIAFLPYVGGVGAINVGDIAGQRLIPVGDDDGLGSLGCEPFAKGAADAAAPAGDDHHFSCDVHHSPVGFA